MSDEVESMMYVGETPWHGLGVSCESAPTVEEAIKKSGLDWEVEARHLITHTGEKARHRGIYRTSDGAKLGEVGPKYKPLQNREAFEAFQPFLDTGKAVLETAGSLRGGSLIWVLARLLGDPLTIVPKADDIVRKFILLAHGHQQGRSVKWGFVPIRVVCANTLGAALSAEASRLLRIPHKGDVVGALKRMPEIMNLADQTFEVSAEQYRFLASKGVREKDLLKYVRAAFAGGDPDDGSDEGGGLGGEGGAAPGGDAPPGAPPAPLIPSAEAKRYWLGEQIRRLFETGRGNDRPGVRGTWWALVNGANEYLGYEMGKNQERRLDSFWFARGARINQRLVRIALRFAKNAPSASN
ncbi:DUF932 domain-containing protein [Pendulispora brunnea]|uniref:DUF932 domain-containing protein n=1 Tax=Pendulispora brunnea TaxID=2905690 RepID=A0ABZ2KK43_9BACT